MSRARQKTSPTAEIMIEPTTPVIGVLGISHLIFTTQGYFHTATGSPWSRSSLTVTFPPTGLVPADMMDRMEGEESITMAWVEDTDDILLMMDRDTVMFQ